MQQIRSILKHRLFLPIYVPAVLFALYQGMLIPVLPLYARELGAGYGAVGLVVAAEGIGTLLMDLPAAWVVRRIGLKRSMVAGTLMVMLSVGLLFLAPGIAVVVGLRIIGGMGRALYFLSRHQIFTHVSLTNRGKAIASLGGVLRLGAFIGPALGGGIADVFGLRVPFLLMSALILMTAVLTFGFLDRQPAPEEGEASSFGRLRDALSARWQVLTAAGIGQMFAMMIRRGRRVVVPLYGADVLGLDVAAIGLIESASGAVDMSLFFTAGIIMDRYGRKWAIVPSFIGQAIGMAL
ncbi:MAG: MFS transporter, partial [Chloroflexi bacterium]|nr:MFS transporter [Chloroflexota bacterium]